MTEKPTTADPEQRARQTRVSREQSGLPPEPPGEPESKQDLARQKKERGKD